MVSNTNFRLTAAAAAVSAMLSGFISMPACAESMQMDGGSNSIDADVEYTNGENSTAIGLTNNAELHLNGNVSANVNYIGKGYSDTGAAVKADSGSKIFLGSSTTEQINVTANGPYVNGIWANNPNSSVTVEGKNLTIAVTSDFADGTPQTAGIYAQGNTSLDGISENSPAVIINAENTVITVDVQNSDGGDYAVSAINATSNGIVKINGNLRVVAPYAISVRGHSLLTINEANADRVVQIEGIIQYAGDGNSSTNLDTDVLINLKGSNSYWTGNIMTYSQEAQKTELGLSDKAQWNVKADIPDPTASVLKVQELRMDDGIINAERADQDILVGNLTLSARGGTFNTVTEMSEDGSSFQSANLSIESVALGDESTSGLTVNYTGITSDQLTQTNAETLSAVDAAPGAENLALTEVVEEGNINGRWVRTTDSEGNTSVTQAANVKLANYSAVNAMSLVQWRNEINHLTKRLGDIRASEGTIGAWARVYGGESQWGGANEVEMDHTTIQVGGDYRINNHWIVGGAFSYTDSSADLSNGDADGDSYSIAAYATYTADGGSFLDLIARYGYLKNDITAGNMSLETGSSAFSLSAETGHTFRFLDERAYIEPQIEVTYGFIAGDDDTASNGVRIEQDDFQNLITRVGVRAGFDFPEKKGSLYGMVSYSYDWLGDADGTASQGALRQELSEDLGGGWVTYGIGAQIMMGKSAYFYGELERTSGGDIDNPYLFSAGVRWTF